MNSSKIFFGQILLTLVIILLGLAVATQWVARLLAYAPELGSPWLTLWDIPIYPPHAFLGWSYLYGPYAEAAFRRASLAVYASVLTALVSAVALSMRRARHARQPTTYGSAAWATRGQIRRAGLRAESGVVLGRLGPKTRGPRAALIHAGGYRRARSSRRAYLRHDGPDHVLAFAPPRSGKGVGLVVPTLLTWPESTVVHDLKGENWALTAGMRAQFSHCLYFNPTDPSSACFNPLLEVRKRTSEVRDAQNIADILVDPDGTRESRDHWAKTAHALLVGAILHSLYAEGDKTLAGVARLLCDPSRAFAATLGAMMATRHLGDTVHPVVAATAREMLNKSENERSGVLSTALSFLELYRDPMVARKTARSDFRIRDLMDAAHPVSLYLAVPPSDISRTKPLTRLILNLVGRLLTEAPQVANVRPHRHRLLLMLDEFPALGRLDFFETALAFIAGYGLKAFLIAQSLNQLDKAYGPNNSILDTCKVRLAFAAGDDRTAQRISNLLGVATESRAQKNYTGHRLAPWLSHVMVSQQDTQRPLLTPGEVLQLPEDRLLVMVAGSPPVFADKVRYYQEPFFQRYRLPPPVLSAEGPYPDCPPAWANAWEAEGVKCPLEEVDGARMARGEAGSDIELDADEANCDDGIGEAIAEEATPVDPQALTPAQQAALDDHDGLTF